MKVLTVGDGDFSFSLALTRAFPEEIAVLVATTLLESEQDLMDTYDSAKDNLKELNESQKTMTTILYGVDATRLHLNESLVSSQMQRQFDVILFQHPHLGYDPSLTPEQHCQNHQELLANYLSSTKSLISMYNTTSDDNSTPAMIHVGLSRGAAERWKVEETARQVELRLAWGSPFAASRPIFPPIEERVMDNNQQEAHSNPNQQQKKRKGSRRGHWLGRYGYRHQPTYPQDTAFETNVSDSLHYYFAATTTMSSGGGEI